MIMDTDVSARLRIITSFQQLQHERCETYNKFHGFFKLFTEKRNESIFQAEVKEITSTFSRISSSIRDLIAELEVINTKESLYIADLFLRIQELEKRKLQGTVAIQTKRKKQIIDEDDQLELEPQHVAEMKRLAKEANHIVLSINSLLEELFIYAQELKEEGVE